MGFGLTSLLTEKCLDFESVFISDGFDRISVMSPDGWVSTVMNYYCFSCGLFFEIRTFVLPKSALLIGYNLNSGDNYACVPENSFESIEDSFSVKRTVGD